MSAVAVVIRLLSEAEDVDAPAYPVVIPQDGELPCIVATTIYEDQEVTLSGAQDAYEARVSIACHAATATAVNALGEAVKGALANVVSQTIQSGDSPPETIAMATLLKLGTDLTDYSDDRTVFRRIMDYRVRWWRDA